MAVRVAPLHDRILVKRIEEKETVKGGIIVPDTSNSARNFLAVMISR